MDNLEKLLGPREIAEFLNLKKSTVHRLLADGSLPSVIVTNGERRRSFRVKPSELVKWMKAREVRQ
jgi:excisionase family DNA binding protein